MMEREIITQDDVGEVPADMLDGTDDEMDDLFEFDDSESKEFNRAASGCLTPSPDAGTDKNGNQYWTEVALIREIKHEAGLKIGQSTPGEKTARISMRMEIDQTSETSTGEASPNQGRRLFVNMNFNKTAFARDPDRGQGFMTTRSIEAWSSLVKAFGVDIQNGRRIAAYVNDHREELIGEKFLIRIQQREDDTGRLSDNVQRFMPVPGADQVF